MRSLLALVFPRFALIGLLLLLAGCTALRAFSAVPPDFTAIKPGVTRAAVESVLGSPVSRIRAAPDGQVEDVYEYYTIDNPGLVTGLSNLFRFVFTAGLWEVHQIFFAEDKSTRHRLRIIYDKNDHVLSLALDEGMGDELYFNQFAQ